MTKQELIARIRENFPQVLRDLNQWVVWHFEERDGKLTKVPYAITGYRAESDNPMTWASFDDACHAFLKRGYEGVGFVFSEHDPYAGVDFDKCVHNGEMDDQKEYWMQGLGSYSEYSQSGTGAHTIVVGKLPAGGRKSNKHGVEMYDSLRFFVVTGDRIHGTPTGVNKRQAELEALHAEVFPRKQQSTTNGSAPVDVDAIPADDQELLRRMFAARNGASIEALWNGNMSAYNDDESAADLALCNHLAFYTGKDADRMDRLFRQSGLFRQKWERSARVGETYGAGTIARAIAGTAKVYTGHRNGSANGHVNGAGYDDSESSQPAPTSTEATTEETAPEIDVLKYRAEDGGILDAWLDLHGRKWIFSIGHDQWYRWNYSHWLLDDGRQLLESIQDLMDIMNHECTRITKEAPSKIKAISERYASAGIDIPDSAFKEIERLKIGVEVAKALHKATKRSNARVSSVEGLARNKRKAPTPRFNATESLNLKNGTLNLRSFELLPHNQDDLFTYQLDYEYDPSADCPLWKKFISDVLVKEGTTEPDADLALLFQELMGYSLTTRMNYQVMIWLPGEGGNGKSVAISILKALLGPLATSIDFQTLGTPGNYDLSDVPGKRVVFSMEAEKGGTLSEKYIKAIADGTPLKARPIYGSQIDFCSTAKIWWAMNDKPVIRDTTNAIWRRMKMIPFYRTFDESTADPHLLDKLLPELPGILNWVMEGLVRLITNNRFTGATNAETAKQQYREQSNPVVQWMNTMCVPTAHPATLQGALYASFKDWCIANGEKPITSTQLGIDLGRLKIPKARRDKGVMYHLALIDTNFR